MTENLAVHNAEDAVVATDPSDQAVATAINQLVPAIERGVVEAIRQAFGAGILPTPQQMQDIESELAELRSREKRLAQAALNVLVAFRICAHGDTVFFGDRHAQDLETALSVDTIIRCATDTGAEGLSLLAKPETHMDAGSLGTVAINLP